MSPMSRRTEKNIVLWQANRRGSRLMPTGKERREITNIMKYIAIIALAALAIGLNACSSSTPPATSTTTASTGYTK
jgi:hypothetical protein